MDELVFLGLVALLWLVVVPIVILIKLSGLGGKVREQEDYLQWKIAKLEERLGKLEAGHGAAGSKTEASPTETVAHAPEPEQFAQELPLDTADIEGLPDNLPDAPGAPDAPPSEIPFTTPSPLAASGNALLSAPIIKAQPEVSPITAPEAAPSRPAFQPPQLPPISDPLADILKLAQQLLRKSNMWVLGGTVLLLCALVFLAKLAIDAGWYTPSLRLATGGLLGVALLAFGWRSRESKPQLGQILQGGGVAAFYLVVIAAVKLHDMIPAAVGLPLLLVLVALASTLAVLQNAPWMAHVSMVSGFFAPVLMSDGSGNYVALFSVFIVLNAGLMFMFAFREWGHLCLTGFILTYGIGGLWGLDAYRPEMWPSVEPFLLAFTAGYGWIAWRLNGLIGREKQPEADVAPDWAAVVFSAPRLHLFFILATPAVFLIYQLTVMGHLPFAMALTGLGLGFIYLAGAWQTWKRHGQSRPYDAQVYFVLAVTGLNLALLFCGLDTGFDRAAMLFYLGVTWVVEGGLFVYISRHNAADALTRPKFMRGLGGVLCLIGSLLSFTYAQDIPAGDPSATVWQASVNIHILAGTLLAAVFLLAAAWGCRAAPQADMKNSSLPVALKGLGAYSPVYPLSFILTSVWLLLGLQFAFAEFEHGLTWSSLALAAFVSGAMLARARLDWGDLRYLLILPLLFALPALFTAGYTIVQVLLAADFGDLAYLGMPLDDFIYTFAPLALFFVPVGLDCLLSRRAGSRTRELVHLLSPGIAFAVMLTALPTLLQFIPMDASLNYSGAWFMVLPLILALLALALLTRLGGGEGKNALPPRLRLMAWYAAAILPLIEIITWQFNTLAAEAWVEPLPYIPLLNPLDLGAGLACLTLWFWWQKTAKLHDAGFSRPLPVAAGQAAICVMAFAAGHGLLLRAVAVLMYNSIYVSTVFPQQLAQVCVTLYWGICGFTLMFTGSRLKTRRLWACGALLLLVAALKTVILDTSSAATLARVAVYFGIGVLFICTGYFIPVPGSRSRKDMADNTGASKGEE